MADVKKIHSRKTNVTYDIKDEVARQQVATKQDAITDVSVNYQEDGGSPDASVQFSGGELAFSMMNMKMKFSELTEEEKAEITGPKGDQGDSAVYNPDDPDTPDFVMANTIGQSTTKAMTQKAVTDAIEAAEELCTEKSTTISTDLTSQNCSLGASSWHMNSTTQDQRHVAVDVAPGMIVSISHSNSEHGGYYAFLTSSYNPPYVNNNAIPYVSGTSRVYCAPGEIARLTIPEGCKYLVLNTVDGASYSFTWTVTTFYTIKDKVAEVEDTFNEALNDAVVDTITEVSVYSWNEVDTSGLTVNNWTLSGTPPVWTAGNNNNNCVFLPVTPGKIYKVHNSGTTYHAIFLTSGTPGAAGTSPALVDENADLSWGHEERIMIAPSNATHMYLRRMSSGVNHIPTVEVGITVIEAMQGISVFDEEAIDYMSLEHSNVYLPLTGVWTSSANGNDQSVVWPVEKGTIYKVVGTGNNFHFIFLRDDDQTVGATPNAISTGWTRPGTYYIPAPDDAAYCYLRIRTAGTWLTGVSIKALIPDDAMAAFGESIRESAVSACVTSDDEDVFRARQAHMSHGTALGLLHFSDIHGDTDAANALFGKITALGDLVDDVLCTGDCAEQFADGTSDYPNGTVWWQGCGLAELSLYVVGNHDAATSSSTEYDVKEGGAAWNGKGKEWTYDNYIAPYADNLGIVRPTGYNVSTSPYYKACFWHKDYDEQGIRVIGLDPMNRFDGIVEPNTGEITTAGVKHLTNEQELWLIERLNETLAGSGDTAEGYKVVFASHWALDDYDGDNLEWNETSHMFICNFNDNGGKVIDDMTNRSVRFQSKSRDSLEFSKTFNWRNRVGTPSSYTKGNVNNIGEIIQSWMDRGAKAQGLYLAFVCGHLHWDAMFYPTRYPDLLQISLTQAGWLHSRNESDKTDTTYKRLTANYITFDVTEGLIRLVRIGQNVDMAMQQINMLCYDYINRKVISEG